FVDIWAEEAAGSRRGSGQSDSRFQGRYERKGIAQRRGDGRKERRSEEGRSEEVGGGFSRRAPAEAGSYSFTGCRNRLYASFPSSIWNRYPRSFKKPSNA